MTNSTPFYSKFFQLKAWADRHEWLLVLICIMLFLRLPSLFEPLWYGDEAIYLAIGQAIRQGMTLYLEVTDYPNKTPMIYWLAAWTTDLVRLRFLLMLWQIPGVIGFYYLAKKFSHQTGAFFASLLFIFLTSTPILEGNIANAEIFFIVPSIVAMTLLWYFPKKIWTWLVAGSLFGLAFVFKIHGLFELLSGLIFFFGFNLKKFDFNSLKQKLVNQSLGLFLVGALWPVLAMLLILLATGVTFSQILADLSQSQAYATSWSQANWLAQTLGMGHLGARLGFLILGLLGLWLVRHKLDKPAVFVAIWFLMSLFAALLSARPYTHYLLQIIPALSLLGLLLFQPLKHNFNSKLVLGSGLVLVGAAFVRFGFPLWPVKAYYQNVFSYATGQIDQASYYRNFDSRMPRNYAIAQTIRNLSGPEDSIYVWGNEADIYVLANRVQVGKVVVSFHVDDLDYYQETLDLLQKNPPEIIVVMETENRIFPGLTNFISSNYYLISQIGDPGKSAEENLNQQGLIYKKASFKF